MATGEIYLPLYVGFPNDPKVRALARFGSPDAGLARDLYVQMCLYCKSELTDGWVPAEQVGLLVYPLDLEHGNQLAKQLASVGLTNELSKNEAPGWQVVAFLRRNRSREQVDDLSNKRAIAGATGGRKSRKRAGQSVSQSKAKQPASNLLSNLPPKDRVRDRGTTELSNESSAAIESRPDGQQPLSVTQRSRRITDAYAEAEPMCKWPAVNGVVIKAIQSEKFSDDEIRGALLRMAKEGRGVTVESLRVEMAGLTPRSPRQPESTGAERARAAREAGQRVQQALDGGIQ